MVMDIRTLKNNKALAGLSERALDEIARYCILINKDKGEMIQLAGDTCTAVYIVQSGLVQIFQSTSEGREQVMEMLADGSMFNIVPPLTPVPYNRASARAMIDSRLIMIPMNNYQDLLKSNLEFANLILNEFAQRLSHLTRLVENLALYSVRARLARFLLAQANETKYKRPMTQDEIAAHLGTVRDVIGRTLRAFECAGLLRREREKIILLDRPGMESEAVIE